MVNTSLTLAFPNNFSCLLQTSFFFVLFPQSVHTDQQSNTSPAYFNALLFGQNMIEVLLCRYHFMAAGFTHAAISHVKQSVEEKSWSSFHTVRSWVRVADASDLMTGVEECAHVSSVLDGGFAGRSGQRAELPMSPCSHPTVPAMWCVNFAAVWRRWGKKGC